jgi:hypothetical protein
MVINHEDSMVGEHREGHPIFLVGKCLELDHSKTYGNDHQLELVVGKEVHCHCDTSTVLLHGISVNMLSFWFLTLLAEGLEYIDE